MVGYELLSEPQRDITAETAAERLRSAIIASSLEGDPSGA
jgi:galactose-1-phosphate uridylyltransferase